MKQVAAAIMPLEKTEFCRRCFGLRKRFLWFDRTDYDGPIDEEDFEYSWEYFEFMKAFFTRAAAAGRSTVFTADQ